MSFPYKYNTGYNRANNLNSNNARPPIPGHTYNLHNGNFPHRHLNQSFPPNGKEGLSSANVPIMHPPDFNMPPPPYKVPPIPYKGQTSSAPRPQYYQNRPPSDMPGPVKRPSHTNTFRYPPKMERQFPSTTHPRERNPEASRNRFKSMSQSTYESPHQPNYTKEYNTKQHSSSRTERSSSLSSSSASASQKDNRDKTKRPETERDRLLSKWRSNYCETSEDITRKLEQLADNEEKECWIRSSPADIYYKRTSASEIEGTSRLEALCKLFKEELVDRGRLAKEKQPPAETPPRKHRQRICRHKCNNKQSNLCSSRKYIRFLFICIYLAEKCSSSDSSDDEFDIDDDCPMEELTKKIKHPYRLHPDLWHNEDGEMNDGPLCRCSAKSRRTGIRHGIYPGEEGFPKCLSNSNNAGKLYHYR